MIVLFALVVAVLSALTILFVILRKVPALRVIDVKTIPEERSRELKEKLIMERFERSANSKWRIIAKVAGATVQGASKVGRRAVQRLYAIEQYYQKLNRNATEGQHAYTQETIKKITDEAERLIQQEEYIPAEKMYIEIISHNPRNVDAYEGLGNMYLSKKEYDQARETLLFALRLSPNDASVNVSLAELEMTLAKPKAALAYVRKAIGKRSKNPKYLDFYIEAALEAGSLKDARTGIQLLRKVNPDNQKIPDFEERFDELKAQYIAKTKTTVNS